MAKLYGFLFIAMLVFAMWPAAAKLERNRGSFYYFKEAEKRILKVLLRGLIYPVVFISGYYMKNSILNEFKLVEIVIFSIIFCLLPVFGVIQTILVTIQRNDKK